MAKIIAIENSKGGSTKSTDSTNLARGLQLQGNSVLLVDRDPQGTTTQWREISNREDYPMVLCVDKDSIGQIKKISDNFDYVIIDGASKVQEILVSSIKVADLVLIPLQPSWADAVALKELVSIIKLRQEITDGVPKAAFLIAREKKKTIVAEKIEEVLEVYDLPVLQNRISDSVIYNEAFGTGRTVFDVNTPAAREKAAEIEAIIDELKQRRLI